MTEEELRERAADYLYLRITGMEKSIELMDDRMSSIEGFFDSLQRKIAVVMEDKPQSDAQWIEQRLRALEDRVKFLPSGLDFKRAEDMIQTQYQQLENKHKELSTIVNTDYQAMLEKYILLFNRIKELEDMKQKHCNMLGEIMGMLYVK
jgi:hypothetical protein